jgi:hypothetical protein
VSNLPQEPNITKLRNFKMDYMSVSETKKMMQANIIFNVAIQIGIKKILMAKDCLTKKYRWTLTL